MDLLTGLGRAGRVPMRLAGLAVSPARALFARETEAVTGEPEFRCPACGYEREAAPPSSRYRCPRCQIPLGPRTPGGARQRVRH